jgi:hypothetical protein
VYVRLSGCLQVGVDVSIHLSLCGEGMWLCGVAKMYVFMYVSNEM